MFNSRKNKSPLAKITVAASLCVGLLASPLLTMQASASTNVDILKFKYSQFELVNAYMAGKVFERLDRSVDRHCTQTGSRSITDINLAKSCKAELLASLVNKINDPLLYAHYNKSMQAR